MRILHAAVLSALFIAVGCAALAAPEMAGPQGMPLVEGDPLDALELHAYKVDPPSGVEFVEADHAEFGRALRVTTGPGQPAPWGVSLTAKNTGPSRLDDVIYVSFYARAVAAGDGDATGKVGAWIFGPALSYIPQAHYVLDAGPEWERVSLAFAANWDMGPGKHVAQLRFGFGPQTVEIGGLRFENLGRDVRVADLDLPRNEWTYGGREQDDPWRAEAEERIERIRKGDLAIVVKDAQGNPVEGALVEARLRRHAFWFGTEIRSLILLADPGYMEWRRITASDVRKYQDTVKRLFNIGAFGNAMVRWYWNAHGRESAIRAVEEWLEPNGIALRAIPLYWGGSQIWKNPEGLDELSADELRANLNAHAEEVLTVMEGKAVMWDVLSEPTTQPEQIRKLGRDEAIEWFKLARRHEPHAKLYANEVGVMTRDKVANDFIELVRYLIENGAPIDGVSPQSHFFLGTPLPSMDFVKERFDRLAELGLEVYPDQLEAVVPDEHCQADFVRDFYTMAFSHPAVVGVTYWGVWEGDVWLRDAAWFRRDWSMKPVARMFVNLIYGKWWTNARGTTDAGGRFEVRGFLGDYDVVVTAGDRTKSVQLLLPRGGTTIEITIED